MVCVCSLSLLLCFLPYVVPLEDGNYPRSIDTPKILQPSGAICSHHFMLRKFETGTQPTVARTRALCKDYGTYGPPASVGQPQLYVPIRLSDVTIFFKAISSRYSGTPIARSFSFFADSDTMCQSVKFKAFQYSSAGHYSFTDIKVQYRITPPLPACPISEVDNTVTTIVCVRDNCTLPPPPPPPTQPPVAHQPGVVAVAGSADTVKDCMRYLGDDVVPAQQYNNHRLWVIVAGVACNLVSMAFLAGMIHYCLKYRHLRRQFRHGAGSFMGTASPTPAVRHLGSAAGSQIMQPAGGPYPDYQYSSIARRKLKAQQQRQGYGRHPMDDETLSYRSDHTRLLMPGSNGGVSVHHMRQGSISTLQRHGSGAVSPPRGWGQNEAPSTPGSIRRHGSISAVSMTSSGYPRRNGTLPPPPPQVKSLPSPQTPPPPPPPPLPADPSVTVIY